MKDISGDIKIKIDGLERDVFYEMFLWLHENRFAHYFWHDVRLYMKNAMTWCEGHWVDEKH